MLLGIIILIWSEGGNELNKLLPGVLLFCVSPTNCPNLSLCRNRCFDFRTTVGWAQLIGLQLNLGTIKPTWQNLCVHSRARPPLSGAYQDTPCSQGSDLSVITGERERENISNQNEIKIKFEVFVAPWLTGLGCQPCWGLVIIYSSRLNCRPVGRSLQFQYAVTEIRSQPVMEGCRLSFRCRNKQMNIITTL